MNLIIIIIIITTVIIVIGIDSIIVILIISGYNYVSQLQSDQIRMKFSCNRLCHSDMLLTNNIYSDFSSKNMFADAVTVGFNFKIETYMNRQIYVSFDS
jgi:hypothetical protein